jgi:hypothetical protein
VIPSSRLDEAVQPMEYGILFVASGFMPRQTNRFAQASAYGGSGGSS